MSTSAAASNQQTLAKINANERLIVALDVPEIELAKDLARKLAGTVDFLKLGPWLQLVSGFDRLIDDLLNDGHRIFLDTKGCDIPETMRAGVAAAARRGISFLTIHGNGEVSDDAMRAAVEGKGSDLKVFSVTVLTSLDQGDLAATGYDKNVEELALTRAARALRCGCDGVIASGHEAHAIKRQAENNPFMVISPGIRPSGSKIGDHKRASTPSDAITQGADYLVVGRPIIHAADPARAAEQIIEEMQVAFDNRWD